MSLHDTAKPNTPQQQPLPVGGFIIDAQGREVPITEEMIQYACQALEQNRQSQPERR